MNRLSLALAISSLLPGMIQAQSAPASSVEVSVPRWIRFSGQLKNAAGTLGITFTLHKGQQDSAALWTETQSVKLDAEGRYTVLLGSTHPEGIPMELFTSGDAQWLAIHIDGQPEQRVLLVSVPYALKAAEAETLAGHSAAEFVTTDHLSSAVQQELQATSASPAPKARSPIKTAVTNPATNFTDSNTSQVVLVTQSSTGAGLVASSGAGNALRANSTAGSAIAANSTGTTGATYGVLATNASTTGTAVRGSATATTGITYGLFGAASSAAGFGVYGVNIVTSGAGVGIYGKSSGTTGIGVRGLAGSATGATTGVQAWAASPSGTALVARNSVGGKLISGQTGASFREVFAVDGAGNITGNSLTSTLVQGASTDSAGYGGLFSGAPGGSAVSANGGSAPAAATTAGTGVIATGGTLGASVTSAFGGDGGDFYGGDGDAGAGNGVSGTGGNVLNGAAVTAGVGGYFIGGNPDGDGLYAAPAPGGTGNAATLDGNVVVNGAVTTAAAVMRIDHPLDPANQYLDHVAVQSSENINVYTGNVILGANGMATVTLPKWFEAINTDFRYQLTPIGAAASLYISKEIHDGSFTLAGGTPGLKVSWSITALRHDPYAFAHPARAEVAKPASERGRYLHPELYGHPAPARITAKPHTRPHKASVQTAPSQ